MHALSFIYGHESHGSVLTQNITHVYPGYPGKARAVHGAPAYELGWCIQDTRCIFMSLDLCPWISINPLESSWGHFQINLGSQEISGLTLGSLWGVIWCHCTSDLVTLGQPFLNPADIQMPLARLSQLALSLIISNSGFTDIASGMTMGWPRILQLVCTSPHFRLWGGPRHSKAR